jgi:hypothetical protein
MSRFISTTELKQSAKFLSLGALKQRGWTDAAIKKFAPEPDEVRDQPWPHRNSPPMKFYLLARIKKIEQRKTWIAWQEGSAVRKKSAAKAVSTKIAALTQWLDSLVIEVPQMTDEELTTRAVEHYNIHWMDTEKRARVDDDEDFLDRISVNYLRHELSPYEEHLNQIAGKTGAHEARSRLRSLIYNAIEDAYPDLGVECYKQERERDLRAEMARRG